MSAKNEMEAIGIAEGFISAQSESEFASREGFEELVSLILDLTEVDEDTARYYANGYWNVSDMKRNQK